MGMDNLLTDYRDGMFIPMVEVKRREDNGHFEATSCGLKVTHHDQAEAVNRLTEQLRQGIMNGEISPHTPV